jgi:hypothetical protein
MPELIEIEEKPHALENTYEVRKSTAIDAL